jgi:Flp pilus assembly protein TadG
MIPKKQVLPRKRSAFRRGQAAVEWALITPVIALLLVIAGDAMRMYDTSIEVNNAAKAGVQYGAQTPGTAADLAGMQQAAQNDASNVTGMTATASVYCQCPDSSTTFSCDTTNTCSDKRVYVEVDSAATFHSLLQFPGLTSSLQLSGKAKMREQ